MRSGIIKPLTQEVEILEEGIATCDAGYYQVYAMFETGYDTTVLEANNTKAREFWISRGRLILSRIQALLDQVWLEAKEEDMLHRLEFRVVSCGVRNV